MATKRDTAVGIFHSHAAAQRAIRRLKEVGFTDDQIGLVAHDPERRYGDTHSTHTEGEGNKAGTGAAAGAATGAGIGAIWGLGILAGARPAIGPVIAGGALASILASAATAAVAGGLVGALIGLGIPEEEAKYYDEEFQHGRTLVTVRDTTRYPEAQRIMREESGYDYESRDRANEPTSTGGAKPVPMNAAGQRTVYYDDTTRI